MSAPQQPSRPSEPVEAVPPQKQLDPVSGPDGDSSGDQDIDTAGTEADDESPKRMKPPAIDRHR